MPSENIEDASLVRKPVKNQFSNDGSFFENFKRITEAAAKKAQADESKEESEESEAKRARGEGSDGPTNHETTASDDLAHQSNPNQPKNDENEDKEQKIEKIIPERENEEKTVTNRRDILPHNQPPFVHTPNQLPPPNLFAVNVPPPPRPPMMNTLPFPPFGPPTHLHPLFHAMPQIPSSFMAPPPPPPPQNEGMDQFLSTH